MLPAPRSGARTPGFFDVLALNQSAEEIPLADLPTEIRFTQTFFQSLKTIEAAIGRRTRMRQIIERYDNNVVAAWKHLKSEVTFGFFELGRNQLLSYSIEYQMLKPEWRDVFEPAHRKEAVEALAEIDPKGDWLSRVDDDYVLE